MLRTQNHMLRACIIVLLLALLSGCGVQATQGTQAGTTVMPVLPSTEDELLRGIPLGGQDLAFTYRTDSRQATLRWARVAKGQQVASGEATIPVEGEGSFWVVPRWEGNVVFFHHEGMATTAGAGVTTTRTTLIAKVDNAGLSSDFHTSLPQGEMTASAGDTLWLAAVSTDKAATTQLFEPAVYADEDKLGGYEELLLFTCVFR